MTIEDVSSEFTINSPYVTALSAYKYGKLMQLNVTLSQLVNGSNLVSIPSKYKPLFNGYGYPGHLGIVYSSSDDYNINGHVYIVYSSGNYYIHSNSSSSSTYGCTCVGMYLIGD